MNKDVVYIDVEDDITAIIGKVKSSNEKIVALVPPKRIGVLQSAVNLRLLQRAATQADKRIVLITNNQALSALSAAASIPVAKNLQSKPEIAEIPALDVDNGEDVIDGSQLPVGDIAKAVDKKDASKEDEELIEGIDIGEAEESAKPKPIKKSSAKKVPDFNVFRKKLLLILGAGAVLIGVLIWAFVFAPAATVIITARTTTVPVSGVVALGTTTDAEVGTIKADTQTIEREASVDFEATGERDVGEKATGTVKFSNSTPSSRTIAAGTELSSTSGKVYVLDTSVTVAGASLSWCGGTPCASPGTATGSVTAAEAGTSYNAATGSVSGAGVSASFVGATSGGTTKVVPIVLAADVQAAKEKLVAESTDDVRRELKGKFADSVQVIDASFVADRQDATSAPAVGAEAPDKKAKLTSKVTYRLNGVERSEIDNYLRDVLKKQMQDQTTQKVYKTGVDMVKLNDFVRSGDAATVRLVTTGHIGPVINEDDIKEAVLGKRFGDIQNELTKVDGISDVEVKFSYFWVRTVPKNVDKVTIEFNVENASE
ncbi:MAG TPA: hypothetical protein PKD28_01745 [Candidatus Saccharibacteria bacterium]|nr:hypothetical protein [Candidatus Saccharibacteria bacterium]